MCKTAKSKTIRCECMSHAETTTTMPRAHGDPSEMLTDVRRTARTVPLFESPLSFARNRSCAADYNARGRGSMFQTQRGYAGWSGPRPDEQREASVLSHCVLRHRKCSGCVARRRISFGQLQVGFGWSRGLNCTKSRERKWAYRSIPVASARGTLQRGDATRHLTCKREMAGSC